MENLSPEEKAKLMEQEEDEYFEQMLTAFQQNVKTDVDDDIEYFQNHPMTCKELTPEMLEQPEFAALQDLAYEGTPEEVCRNFRHHAMESLHLILEKYTKNKKHD